MKKLIEIAVIIVMLASYLEAKDTIVIGHTMYQNQLFSAKDKHVFDADREGSRVWNWENANNYCKKLKLDGYGGWKVASQKELQSIMMKKSSTNSLYVKSTFYMPATGGKYDDIWMWTRDSKKSNLGAFVNFKKAKSGWANKKYKGYVICTRSVKSITHTTKKTTCKDSTKQELTHSTNWVKAWNTCSGYTALKKDGTLWQFGKVGGCNWGQIIPVDPQTGKSIYNKKIIYHLKPKKIGVGFKRAKIINGGYRMYAVKKDGTLWGWGEGLGVNPKKLNASRGWSYFGIKYEGNGCCSYDVGLKKNGTLWRFPESAFAQGKYKTTLKLQKISRFSDWKKIVLGCCNIYGLRKDGSLWRSSLDDKGKDGKMVFKKYKAKKKTYDGDMELYPYLKSKMAKVISGTIYSPNFNKKVKVNKDGTLCLLPKITYD